VKLRAEFVLKALEPEACMAELCREFGISRKTGYKWLARFRARGMRGLDDLSRRPHQSPLRASGEGVLRVIEMRQRHPSWGPKKLHVVLKREPTLKQVLSVRTIARILSRAGEVLSKRRIPSQQDVSTTAPQIRADTANETWTVDFKGWWRSNNGEHCEPLTVRDAASRFVLCADLVQSRGTEPIRLIFQALFEKYGLPACIHVDNGSPFACTRSRGGLTRLSAWWVSLGIRVERGRPGCPQDNGAHERMHADISCELQMHAADTKELQQAALDEWRHEFNHVRPHESLQQQTPATHYVHSSRPFRGPRCAVYPGCQVRKVATTGIVKCKGKRFRVGQGLAGFDVGLLPLGEGTFRLFFYELNLGEIGVAA